MLDNLKGRLIRGVSANGLGQIVTVLIQIVSVPIFLKSWGNELYGEWLILSAIPTYLSLSDMGFTTAAANEMNMKVAENNRSAASEIFQSMRLLITIISLTLSSIVILVTSFLPVNTFLNVTHLNRFEVLCVISALTLYVLTGMQKSLVMAAFRCDGNFAFGVTYGSLLRLLEYVGVTTVVLLGASPVIAALVFWLICTFSLFLMVFSLSKKSPWLFASHNNAVNWKTITGLVKPAMASMCFPLSTAINNQGITIAIGSILGPKDVVVFSTLRTLSRLALQVMVMIKDATSPEISSAYARNDMMIARKLHRYSCQFSLWLGLIFIALIAFSGKWIIQTWTHGIVKFDFVLLCIMLSSVLISSFWYISIAVLTSTNNHQKAAIWYLIGTLLSLGLAITTLPKLGLNGAAISLAFADIWMLTFVVKNSLILLQDDLSSYLQVILIPPFLKEFNKFFNRI